MTTNDEQWDDRLRSLLGSQSETRVDIGEAVLRRVRNRRRWKVGAISAAVMMLGAGVVAWSLLFSNGESTTHSKQPKQPIVKHEPNHESLAEMYPPPVERLDVIGRHQDAFVAVFEQWNEEQP